MDLYLQPVLFEHDGAPPLLGTLSVSLVDGTLALGASVYHLVSLQTLALTAEPGLVDVDGRAEAHQALDDLLNALDQLHRSEPI